MTYKKMRVQLLDKETGIPIEDVDVMTSGSCVKMDSGKNLEEIIATQNSEILNIKNRSISSKYEKASGTATAILLNIDNLSDGCIKNFIATSDNNGIATKINDIPLYKVLTTIPPTLKANKPYEIYYDETLKCFFLKASATGTAKQAQVLAGVPFSNEDDTDLIGTMINNGKVSKNLNCGNSYVIPNGYHDGTGVISANSLASQTSATATADKIQSGYTAYVNGKKITGTGASPLKTASGNFNGPSSSRSTQKVTCGFKPKAVFIQNLDNSHTQRWFCSEYTGNTKFWRYGADDLYYDGSLDSNGFTAPTYGTEKHEWWAIG